MAPDEYDLAAAGTGIVDADHLLGPDRVRAGDVLVAMRSSGLHSNGFSLARHVLMPDAAALGRMLPEVGRSVGEELLEPTRIYTRDCLALAETLDVHAFSHVTGGGIAANIARVLPAELAADVDRNTWIPQPIFTVIADRGSVEQLEMERTFNMGLGMVAVVNGQSADQAVDLLTKRGVDAWVCGVVRDREAGEQGDAAAKGGSGGAVRVIGEYRTDGSA
jgi:phosphoribosylformylglycinamidine cyclo-ligase